MDSNTSHNDLENAFSPSAPPASEIEINTTAKTPLSSDDYVTLYFSFAETGAKFEHKFKKTDSIHDAKSVLYGLRMMRGDRVTFVCNGQRLQDDKPVSSYPFLLRGDRILVNIVSLSSMNGDNGSASTSTLPPEPSQSSSDHISRFYTQRRQQTQSSQQPQSQQRNNFGFPAQVPSSSSSSSSSASLSSSNSRSSSVCGRTVSYIRSLFPYNPFVILGDFLYRIFLPPYLFLCRILSILNCRRHNEAYASFFNRIEGASMATVCATIFLALFWITFCLWREVFFDTFSSFVLYILTFIFFWVNVPGVRIVLGGLLSFVGLHDFGRDEHGQNRNANYDNNANRASDRDSGGQSSQGQEYSYRPRSSHRYANGDGLGGINLARRRT